MTISLEDAHRLTAAGFVDSEVEAYATATDPKGNPQPPIDLNSPAWQAALKSRREWIEDKVDRGWSPEEINAEILGYYARGAKRNPWDFLKIEYKDPQKVDYRAAVRRRAKARVTAVLGKY